MHAPVHIGSFDPEDFMFLDLLKAALQRVRRYSRAMSTRFLRSGMYATRLVAELGFTTAPTMVT
jgi:hypothetical protein